MLHADDHIWDEDGPEDHHAHHDHHDHLDTDEDFKTTTISSESKNQPPAFLSILFSCP